MSFTVTATQGGNTAGGMALALKVVTGAATAQPGATAGNQGTAASQAITPNGTGSIVYGAALGGNTTLTAAATTTFIQQYTADSLRFIQLESAATTTAGTPVTLGASSATTGLDIALAEILASPGLSLAEDASSPAVASVSNTTSLATAAFNPPPGSLLVLMVATNGAVGTTTVAVSDTSGLGLTWTQQSVENGSSKGYAGVWTAYYPVKVVPPPRSPGLSWRRRFTRRPAPPPPPRNATVPVTVPQPIRVVQSSQGHAGAGAGSTVSVTLPANTTAGNCLVVCTAHFYISGVQSLPTGVSIGGITDNFAQAVSDASDLTTIWTDQNCIGGQNTVTVNFNTASNHGAWVSVYEVAGLASSGAADKTASVNASLANWTVGPAAATSQASEIYFGCIFDSGGSGTPVVTGPPSPWVNIGTNGWNTGSGYSSMSGYLIATGQGAPSYSGTFSAVVSSYGSLVTLKAASPGSNVVGATPVQSGRSWRQRFRPRAQARAVAAEYDPLSIGMVLPKPSLSATARVSPVAAGGVTLPGPSLAGSATEIIPLTAGIVLPKLRLSASAAESFLAVGRVTLPKPSLALASRVTFPATTPPLLSGTASVTALAGSATVRGYAGSATVTVLGGTATGQSLAGSATVTTYEGTATNGD